MAVKINNREQEAVTFIGRKGVNYVEKSATKSEREYFQGYLYNRDGMFEKNFLKTFSSIRIQA